MSLQIKAVDRIFHRLAATYGADFMRKYEGVDEADMKTVWAHELGGFAGDLMAIAWALENLPERCPNVIEFRAICRKSPRVELPQRQWGVYAHDILVTDHPLLSGISAPMQAPHSHRYGVSREAMASAGLTVLVASDEAGVHLAVGNPAFEKNGSQFVYFQGHPEYDAISLLKEYKREIQRFNIGSRQTFPPYPEHYLDAEAKRQVDDYERRVTESDFAQQTIPPFPEESISRRCVNTWHAAGMQIYRNWLAAVDTSR